MPPGTAPKQPERPVTGVRATDSRPPVSSRYQAGELIAGKYRLVRQRGAGGMGTVWVAHNEVLDVDVAIKLIDLSGSAEPEQLAQRLLEEARSAARIGHAAIVRVHDFGKTRFLDPFIAMELLDGDDLSKVLERQQKLPVVTAVRLLLPIVHALAAAHDKNIVHRDVKPENIFLARDDEVKGQPKLLDFGVARMIDNPRKLTLEGSVVGTPDYMSPEQARGETTTAATDQWSLCVVLYELVMGQVPFDAPNYNALLRAIIEDEPAPIFDRELWEIVEKGLRKDHTQRFPSMRRLGEALARYLLDNGVEDDLSGTSLRRVWLREARAEGERTPTTTAARQVTPSSPPADEAERSRRESELQAIAEFYRDGDPLVALEREEQRRQLVIALSVLAIALFGVLAVLVGTGIIVL